MRAIIVNILIALVSETRTKLRSADPCGKSKNSMDKLVDGLAAIVLDCALRAPTMQGADLDSSAFGKQRHLAVPSRARTSCTTSAFQVVGQRLRALRRPRLIPSWTCVASKAAASMESASPIETIRAAADKKDVRPRPAELLGAIVAYQMRRRDNPQDRREEGCTFLEALAGGGSPGRRWRLVYAAGRDAVVTARKSRPQLKTTDKPRVGLIQGLTDIVAPWLKHGLYFDDYVTAIQRFDSSRMENQNGIFAIFGLDWLRFTVLGPFKWSDPIARALCAFRPTTATVALGAWNKSWSLEEDPSTLAALSTSPGKDAAVADLPFEEIPIGKLPFFKFIHVDDKVAVALGRSGGVALWARLE